ncbi:hypothetical protein KJZ99_11505 [bacterium]|nr:hypothetical protein [bacterium]
MKSTTKYFKRLLDQNRRMKLENELRQRRLQDLDIDNYKGDPEEMPDWAKALGEHNNNIRSV